MRRIHAYVVAGVLLAAASLPAAVQAHKTSATDPFRVVSVEVLNASTADVTFSDRVAAQTTDVSRRHFHGDHLDQRCPSHPRGLERRARQ